MLCEGDSFSINGNFGAPEKKLVLILLNETQFEFVLTFQLDFV